MVKNGHLGQKSGSGFYLHEKGKVPGKDEARKPNPELEKLIKEAQKQAKDAGKSSKPFDAFRVMLPMFNEAVYAIQEGVVDPDDVDLAMQWGCGMTKGLLSTAEGKGLGWCLSELERYNQELGERFRPSWLLKKLVRARVENFASLKIEPVAAR